MKTTLIIKVKKQDIYTHFAWSQQGSCVGRWVSIGSFNQDRVVLSQKHVLWNPDFWRDCINAITAGQENQPLLFQRWSNIAAATLVLSKTQRDQLHVMSACARANQHWAPHCALYYMEMQMSRFRGYRSCCNAIAVGILSMWALSKRNDDPDGFTSFDRERDGFVMSEGAAFLVLDELEHQKHVAQ
jgi:3-oxoacyl-[acyl-carrier-protein] synthase II